jgi:hypothetical protein
VAQGDSICFQGHGVVAAAYVVGYATSGGIDYVTLDVRVWQDPTTDQTGNLTDVWTLPCSVRHAAGSRRAAAVWFFCASACRAVDGIAGPGCRPRRVPGRTRRF